MSLHFHESLVSPVPSPVEPLESMEQVESMVSIPELHTASTHAHMRIQKTKKVLADMLQTFCLEDPEYATLADMRRKESPLAQTVWARSQIVDMFHMDMLNLFCEKLRAREQRSMEEERLVEERLEEEEYEEEEEEDKEHLPALLRDQLKPNVVLRPRRRERWLYPILRLQEAKAQDFGVFLRSHKMRSKELTPDGSLRVLKLPLPRVDLQPFPPGWPAPPRALPPLLLQPSLQRYFLLKDTDPEAYS